MSCSNYKCSANVDFTCYKNELAHFHGIDIHCPNINPEKEEQKFNTLLEISALHDLYEETGLESVKKLKALKAREFLDL